MTLIAQLVWWGLFIVVVLTVCNVLGVPIPASTIDPLHVDSVAVDHREVNFVICHPGNPRIRDCMEVVYENANAYTDISGLVPGTFSDRFETDMRKQVQEMLLYGVEPEKVLYGTDWPISSMESYLEFMREIATPEPDRKKIMGENALSLYGLDRRQSLVTGGR